MKPTLNIIAIGVAAGVLAAIFSAGSVVQNVLSFILFMLSPLPIVLAGLAFGPLAAVVSVIACGLSIVVVAGDTSALVMVVTTAIPAAVAAYFGGMARIEHGRAEWYPLGSILLLVALTVACGFVIFGIAVGLSAEFVEMFSQELVKELVSTNAEFAANPAATKKFVSFMVAAIPYLQPGTWLLVIMGNLWLALFLARRSGLFNRPKDNWPDALNLPVYVVALLVLAVLGSFLSTSFGTAIAAFAGALGMAFTMTGFAFMHVNTRGKPWRAAALWLSYLATLSFSAAPIFLFVGLYRSAKNPTAIGLTP